MRLLLISTLLVITSCQNCICLPSEGLRLATVSFDSTEIDTIIVREFEKGSGFSRLIDSVQWDRSNVIFSSQHDTSRMGIVMGDLGLKSQFDYQVLIAATGKIYQITELNEPKREAKCPGKTICANLIVSCKLEGSPTLLQHEILYLRK
jgi:hypothetical protein